MAVGRYIHGAATGNYGPVTPAAELRSITVNQGTATAILTVYDGQDNTGTVVAVIDAATKSFAKYEVYCPKGIFVVSSVANCDFTIAYR